MNDNCLPDLCADHVKVGGAVPSPGSGGSGMAISNGGSQQKGTSSCMKLCLVSSRPYRSVLMSPTL